MHFDSKRASRHNGVQFFISHLARLLRTRRFSEPTFRPSRATNHWKNSFSRLSYLFAHLDLLSSGSFSSLSLSLLLFSSLTLPTSAFPSAHIVGSLTSKLPSRIVSPFQLQALTERYVHAYAYVYIYIHTSTYIYIQKYVSVWSTGRERWVQVLQNNRNKLCKILEDCRPFALRFDAFGCALQIQVSCFMTIRKRFLMKTLM